MIKQICVDERNNIALPELKGRIVNRKLDVSRFLGEFGEDISLIQSLEYSGVMIYSQS